jgi:peroxiredoxin Q/BCP
MKSWIPGLGLLLAIAAPAGAAMVDAGKSFPAWKLTDHTGTSVSSDQLAGKAYLVWFYPAAMTPGCTAEGRGLRDEIDAYRSAGIEILGVSFDRPEDNRRFVESESFPFRLLSDSDRKLALAVGAATAADQGYARRISYLVGPDRKVIEAYDQVNPTEHAAEVLADYAASLKK